MNFNQAFEKLIDGQIVTRSVWDSTGEYVVLMPGMDYAWKVIHQPKTQAGQWMPMVEDVLANDWKTLVTDKSRFFPKKEKAMDDKQLN